MSSALLMNAGAALAPGASSSQASVARARPRRLCSPGTSVVRRLDVPRSLVTPLGFIPVDHVPPRLYVLRPPVLVLQVIGVLPHIQPHYRRLALHQRRVLVWSGLYGQGTIRGGYQP